MTRMFSSAHDPVKGPEESFEAMESLPDHAEESSQAIRLTASEGNLDGRRPKSSASTEISSAGCVLLHLDGHRSTSAAARSSCPPLALASRCRNMISACFLLPRPPLEPDVPRLSSTLPVHLLL